MDFVLINSEASNIKNCCAGDRSRSGLETASSLFRDSRKGDKYSLFQRYSLSGLRRLGLEPLQDIDFCRIWDEVEPLSVCFLLNTIISFCTFI